MEINLLRERRGHRRSGEGGHGALKLGGKRAREIDEGVPGGGGEPGEGGKGGGGRGFAHHEGPVPPAGGASSPVLTAGDPLQPQHVLGPDRLLPLQWPQPGPRACLQFRLGPRLGFRLRVQLGLHALARGPWSGLRPCSSPAATLLHLHGLTRPRLACCRRGCQLRLERRRGSVRSPTPGRGLRYRPAPPLAPPPTSPPLLKGREPADLGYSRKKQGGSSPWASFIFFKESWLPLLSSGYSAPPSVSQVSSHLRVFAWDALPSGGLFLYFWSQLKGHLLKRPPLHPVYSTI